MNGHVDGQPRSSQNAALVLPRVVEDLARDHGNKPWMIVPRSANLDDGFREVTYQDLSYAVDGMARWVEDKIGAGDGSGVVAYIGLNDTRYGVVEVGLMKAGYKALLPSPRNSPEGHASLIDRTECKLLLHSEGMETHVEAIKEIAPQIHCVQVPTFDDYRDQGAKTGPYAGHYSEAEDATVLVLHTSGSTGLPKPIYLTNGGLAVTGLFKDMAKPKGRQNTADVLFAADKKMFCMSPFFHAMGAIMMSRSLMCRAPLILMPSDKPPNTQLVLDVLEKGRPWSGIFPPSLLEQLVDTEDGLKALGDLEYVFFGGAPLAHESGEKLRQVTNVVSVIGSTEAGFFASRMPEDRADWQYFEFVPEAGVVMELDDDGLSEMVVKPAQRDIQGVFFTFPDIKEWRTKDVWEPHPTKENLWRYKGRKDDVIVLSNGEKLNPVTFEKSLDSEHLVQGTLVVGQGRFQAGLIVEPEWKYLENHDPGALLDELWPAIEKANESMPGHGRVWKSKVAFASKEKPFKRAPKGTVIRQQTNKLYEREIEALYSNEASDDQIGKLGPDADIATTKDFLRTVFKVKGFPIPEDAAEDAELFNFGVDSLQVLALSTTLNHARGARGDSTVSPRDIYRYPTIESLAAYLHGESAEEEGPNREEAMAQMVKKYTQDLPNRKSSSLPALPEKHNVILTGSTGSLGNSILEDLIGSNEVAHIYCLNRSRDAETRQRSSFDDRDVRADFSKVTFLHSDFSKDHFGLGEDDHEKLLQQVTIFVHNAWAVDFNKSLQTYEATHIAGTRRCVDFSIKSTYAAQVVFISSIASVGNWKASHPGVDMVSEELPEDYTIPLPQGYGESKHVASLILSAAAANSNVPATVIRAGQLAGPKGSGAQWNRHEWLPSIIITSKAMGMLPETLGNQDTVDWVPMDLAAKSVLEIAEARSKQVRQEGSHLLSVSHLVNPRITSWTSLVPAIQRSLSQETGKDVQIVPFEDWLKELSSSPRTAEAAEQRPGIKLLDFYEGLAMEGAGLPRLATELTAGLSGTVKGMEAIDAGLMEKWLGQWRE